VIPLPWFCGGIALGAALAALALRARSAARGAALAERLAAQQARAAQLEQQEADLRQRLAAAESARSRLEATLETERQAASEKLRLLDEAREKLRAEFENLANRIFEDRSRKLGDESRRNLESVLTPLKDQLGEFRKRVDDVYDRESQGRASLLNEIRLLKDLNQQISRDALDLTNALKGESKTRGTWGELVLEKVLEQSGLVNGREYETQVYLKEKHGGAAARYPDVIVRLPEQRDVVIDSKVALNDYEAYCAAQSEDDRRSALKAHVAAVRNHIVQLAARRYDELEGIHALDHVVLCIPIEGALVAAVSAEPRLYDEAFERRIVLVGPSTLMLTLRIIAAIWRQEYQQKHALEIAERGRLLYEKFVGFVEDVAAMDRSLDAAREACAGARAKLQTGPGNLIGQAEKLLELGVKARKRLASQALEAATDDAARFG